MEEKDKNDLDASQKLWAESRQSYKVVDEFLTIRAGDNWLTKIGKVVGRIALYVFLIALSPFLLIGLTIAFMAAF